MSEVRVTALEPGAFGVEVDEGDLTTGHRVEVTETFLAGRGLDGVEPAIVVKESILFLLDRQPGTAIPETLSLEDAVREYPDYDDEIRSRVSV